MPSLDQTSMRAGVRRYLAVFAALLGLTVVTVAVAELNVGVRLGLVIALAIASLKASLVALVFMHLSAERRWIYGIVIFVVVMVAGLLFWPAWGEYDRARF
jgi:cytochrome c oxidase subunit IV